MRSIILYLVFVFGVFYVHGQTIDWNKETGWGSQVETRHHISVDNQAHYFVGLFSGTVDFDFGPGVNSLSSNPGTSPSCFILKTDFSGNFLWVKSLPGSLSSATVRPKSMAVDSSGNVIISAMYSGFSVDADPGVGQVIIPGANGVHGLLLKLNSSGDYLWHKDIVNSYVKGVEVDTFGNIYLCGFEDGFPLSVYKTYVRKFNPTGVLLWNRDVDGIVSGGLSSTYADVITIGPNGNVYVAGTFDGVVNFNTTSGAGYVLTGGAGLATSNFFLLKLSPNSAFISVDKQDDIMSTGTVTKISSDNLGQIYYIGDNNQSAQKSFFVKKCNSNLLPIWTKSFYSTSGVYNLIYGLDIDTDENVLLSGAIQEDSIDLNPNLGVNNLYFTPSTGGNFLLKLNNQGNYIWAKHFTTSTDPISNIFLELRSAYFGPQGKIYSAYNTSSRTGLVQIDQGICSTLAVSINSIQNVDCAQIGQIDAYGTGGSQPYFYSWSTSTSTDSSYVTFVPGIHTVNLTDNLGCSASTSVFVFGPTSQTQYDLDIELITTNFRPGASTNVWLDGLNLGCLPASGQLVLKLDSQVSFNYGWPLPIYSSIDTIIWNFTDLVYDSTHITPYINVKTDTSAQLGQSICFETIIKPITGDFNPLNNSKNYCFTVINSYDPNDKKVYPPGKCEEGYIENNQNLTYTVRFQNTGSADAINIVLTDSLDPSLDMASLRLITSSHDVYVEFIDSNIVNFVFNGINLPDSASNEIESHGFAVFSIDPYPNLLNGDEIQNKVDIYFDFNLPITTNEVKSTIFIGDLDAWECVLNLDEFNSQGFVIYPNPFNDIIYIESNKTQSSMVSIIDISGEVIYDNEFTNTKKIKIDMTNELTGLYFIKITTENNSKIHKIIKM